MKQRKQLLRGAIFSSLILSTALATATTLITSCSNDEGDKHINKIDDFTYEITTIDEYSNKLRETTDQPTAHVPSELADEKGIILTGWKDKKPYVIPGTNTVLVHPASKYKVDGQEYNVIAYGNLAFGQEMFDDWTFLTGSEYDYKFIMPESLILMYNSACSWFGAIPTYDLPLCVNSVVLLTGKEIMYPHISVDMSACDNYRDSEDTKSGIRGIFNYNFAFQNVDKFVWPKNNTVWDRIVDDMFEDSYIKCDMDLRGLKNLKEIGHWGCGRWQMPNNDLYLPETIQEITWEAFNGSRFNNIYWNVTNPDELTWNNYEIDPDSAYQEVCILINDFVQNHPDWSWIEKLEPLIKLAIEEFATSQADHDWYVLGNLEFNNFYISEEATQDDVANWQTYFSNDETEGSKSHGASLPTIFWALGMADCPEVSKIGSIIANQK